MVKPSVPSNPVLDHLRLDLQGVCWWCGDIADSHEHKYKRTDLARISDGGLYWGGDPERLHIVKSIKRSKAVRFGKVLCAKCNNARSRPFDFAYSTFSTYVATHLDDLWGQPGLDMQDIYGPDWQKDQLDLARYYAKHIGCRLADEGFVPPHPWSLSLMAQRALRT